MHSEKEALARLQIALTFNDTLDISFPGGNALKWARGIDSKHCYLWEDENQSIAGIGIERMFEALSEDSYRRCAEDVVDAMENRFVFHWRRFVSGTSTEWEPFGFARWVFPDITYRSTKTHSQIVRRGSRKIELRNVVSPTSPTLQQVADYGQRKVFSRAVNSAKQAFLEQQLRKVVLARRATHEGASDASYWKSLVTKMPRPSGSYRFYLQPGAQTAFLGVSPERLFERKQKHVEVDALAGTTLSDERPDLANQLAEKLLNSDKDRVEHDFVTQHIDDKLRSVGLAFKREPTPVVKKLSSLQHLWTPYHLESKLSDAELADLLHPTPAICGIPSETARHFIAQQEHFDRGLYTGLVGLVSKNHTTMLVALRCALANHHKIYAYAGAGIVSSSEAAKEWDEVVNKGRVFSQLLDEDKKERLLERLA